MITFNHISEKLRGPHPDHPGHHIMASYNAPCMLHASSVSCHMKDGLIFSVTCYIRWGDSLKMSSKSGYTPIGDAGVVAMLIRLPPLV